MLFGIPSTIDSILALLPKLRQDAQTDPGRNDVGFFLRKDARNIDDTVERGMDHIKMVSGPPGYGLPYAHHTHTDLPTQLCRH